MDLPVNTITRHIGSESCWGESVPILNEETKAIWSYWTAKKKRHNTQTAHKFLLSATELLQLMNDAGITRDGIGVKPHQYQLARHGDTGDYEIGNCRFITSSENRAEQKSSKGIPTNHPNARITHTPQGTYNSLTEAARAYGVGHKTISVRVESKTERMKEYYYV